MHFPFWLYPIFGEGCGREPFWDSFVVVFSGEGDGGLWPYRCGRSGSDSGRALVGLELPKGLFAWGMGGS